MTLIILANNSVMILIPQSSRTYWEKWSRTTSHYWTKMKCCTMNITKMWLKEMKWCLQLRSKPTPSIKYRTRPEDRLRISMETVLVHFTQCDSTKGKCHLTSVCLREAVGVCPRKRLRDASRIHWTALEYICSLNKRKGYSKARN